MSAPRILIVDDSVTIRNVLSKRLKKMGVDLTEATNGQEGFFTAFGGEYDLIISDIDMPHMNGFEMCAKLKNTPKTSSIPVIMLSSRDKDEDIERGFKCGADAYMTKNSGPDELQSCMENVLRKSTFIKERRILVVEDNDSIREVVAGGLAKAGFQVASAENGLKALDHLNGDKPPDLIVCDLHMPEIDGMQLCKRLQDNPDWASIPLIVMSSDGDRAIMRRMLQVGASSFMIKPFNTEQLAITIEKLLSDQFQIILQEKERLKTEQSMMLGSITSLIQALEARDEYTRGHSEAVAEISVAMGKAMNFSHEELERLEIAARLHDLGKIGIRDAVLLKPGRLTDDEYAIIKTHPSIGGEILKPIPSMADIIPAVKFHHEKMDGSGYPDGLKGDQIPLWARIIAVGDVYHALTSNRPYRDPMPEDKVLSIINDSLGTHLCKDCAGVFLKLIDGKPMRWD